MRLRTVVLVLAAVLILPRLATSQEPKPGDKAAPGAAEAQVIELEHAAYDALVQGDAAAFQKVAGGTFVFLNPSGAGSNTPAVTEQNFKTCRTTSAVPSNLRATSYGPDLVVVTSDVVLDQTCGAYRALPAYRGMSVWQQREGKWRLVAHSQTPFASSALPPVAAAAIERQVTEVMTRFSAAARAVNAQAMLELTSRQNGLCLFGAAGAQATSCKEIWESLRKAWSDQTPNRPSRQEFVGEVIRVQALTPSVAVASWTIPEDRVYGKDGRLIFSAPFADMFVFVLEDGQWRIHSGEQATWMKP